MIAMRVRVGAGRRSKAGPRRTAFARGIAIGQGQNVLDAILAPAKRIRDRWEQLAPEDTGRYKSSIYVRAVRTKGSRAVVVVGTDIGAPDGPKGDVGPYPYFLEYGTSRMEPHPSMRPAIDQEQERATGDAERILQAKADAIADLEVA